METRLISLRIFESMVFLNKKSILGTVFFYFEIPFQTIGNFTDRIFQSAITNHNDDANLKVAQDLSLMYISIFTLPVLLAASIAGFVFFICIYTVHVYVEFVYTCILSLQVWSTWGWEDIAHETFTTSKHPICRFWCVSVLVFWFDSHLGVRCEHMLRMWILTSLHMRWNQPNMGGRFFLFRNSFSNHWKFHR